MSAIQENVGVENMMAYLYDAGEHAINLEPVLQRILNKILIRERRLFETRGASSGVFWAPLRATTIIRKGGGTFKRQRGRISATGGTPAIGAIPYPDRPLWRFGDLMRSLSERHAQYQVLEVSESGFTFGTSHPAAHYHVTGTSRMPARPPLIIPAKHANEYIGDIEDFIFNGALPEALE